MGRLFPLQNNTVSANHDFLEEPMKKLAALCTALLLGISLAGCAGGPAEPSHTQADAQAAIAAAKAAKKKAAAVGYEWRDTGKIIKKAEKALKAGDYAKAVKLAKKAERQSKNALAQYETNKNAQPRL